MIKYKYKVKSAKNGFIFEVNDGEETSYIVGRESNDETSSFMEFLWDILEHYGPTCGKYEEKRIRIIAIPGSCFSGKISADYRNDLENLRNDLNSFLQEEKDDNSTTP